MEYTKPPLSFEQQADLILERALIADRDILISRLRSVNYYRLSGYLYPYRNPDNTFRDGTTLDMVWRHYCFDRELRILVFDAIEKVEIAVRTSVVYHFSHACGPFGHINYNNMCNLSKRKYRYWLTRLDSGTKRSSERFVKHFYEKYDDCHSGLPLWMAAEIMTFGSLLTLFKGMNDGLKKRIAQIFRLPDRVCENWLETFNAIRNICAHHGRLWNRELGYKPLLPAKKKHPEWHTPATLPNNRVFIILTMLKYMISIISPECTWSDQVRQLLEKHPDISRTSMGFPEWWETSPLWAGN